MSSCPVKSQSSSSILHINITKPTLTTKRHFLDKQLDLEARSNDLGEWGGGWRWEVGGICLLQNPGQ